MRSRSTPPGLTALRQPTGNAQLFAGLATGDFSNATNENSAMRLRPGAVPLGAIGTALGAGRWSVGLALTHDLSSSVYWRYADAPGTGGADYGPQSEKSQILADRLAAGAGFAVTRRLSLGATLGVVYNENTLRAPYTFQENPELRGLKTLLALGTRGFGWGGSAGLTLRPTGSLALSLAWSAPVTVNSHGHASGNMGAQFEALDIPFQPDFTYSARVRVKLPQTLLAGGRWQATRSLGVGLQGDWVNYRTAFNRLPMSFTNGNNPDINGFLGANSFQDQVSLRWSDQYILRTALDRGLGEHYKLSAGYTHRTSPVPNGTLTPLNGAIMKDELSTGAEYRRGTLGLAAAYVVNLNESAQVGTSGLLSGEYSHSRLTVGTQAAIVGLSWRIVSPRRQPAN